MPIFIVGSGRCGTTLLQSMLNAHPRIAIPPEDDLHLRLLGAYRGRCPLAGQDLVDFLDDVYSSDTFARWNLPRATLDKALLERSFAGYADLLAALHFEYAAAAGPGKTRWGAKVPYYLSHLRILSGIFPRLKVIHIVRDGRDVLLSMRDRARQGARHFETRLEPAALQWRMQVARAGRDGRRLGESRYLLVRYEDLVAEPEVVLRRVCGFLEEPFAEPMVHSFYENARAMKLHSINRMNLYLHKDVTTDRCGRWKTEMTRDELRRWEAIAGVQLGMHGYERACARAPLALRSKAFAAAGVYAAWSRLPAWTKRSVRLAVGRAGD